MMRSSSKSIAAALFAAASFASLIALSRTDVPSRKVQASERDITWSHDIAPLVYQHCTACHHTGGAGPFSLLTYADAKRWGGLMETVTASRYMPPWLPEPGYGEFQDNRRMSDEEIALIKKWVTAGMPEGVVADAPKPPVYTSEWQLGPPDLVLEVTSPTVVPAQGTEQFLNFILPAGLKQTRWIRAMEVKPGSPRVVHHANIWIDRTDSLRRQHPADWQNGIPGMDITLDSGSSFDPDSHLLFWKPDSEALIEPPTMPWRLDPGNDLILNMHLKPTGKEEHIQARIGLYFASAPAKQFPMLLQLEHDDALNIPAGNANFVVEDKLKLPEAVEVLAVYPHAHYLGKQMEGYAILPNGERKWIIFIKDWDIERQSIYRLAKPMFLPAGTTLHMRYTYDNSADNVRNPHTPPVPVHSGNLSVNEMGHLWLQVLPMPDAKTTEDARVPLERAWMENRLSKDPNDPTAFYNLGSLDLSEGHTAEAEGMFQHALQQKPNDARLLTAVGLTEYQQGKAASAQQDFAKALAADPTYSDAQFDQANLHFSQGKYADAEQGFRRYLQANSGDAAAHTGLGSALLAQGQTDAAGKEFEAALAIQPQNFDALYNLASIAGEANDVPRATSLLQQALAVHEDADAEKLFALIEARAGNMPSAVEHMRKARDLQPKSPELHTYLARMYAEQQNWNEAVTEQKAALALNSSHADDWSLLGIMEHQAGDTKAAQDAFQKALEIDPHNEQALRATAPGPR